ncbi:MAG: hypothetical protein ACK4RK_08375 [Gemmataceae bacterium]
MRFWAREIAGWLLVTLGLLIFFQCYLLLVAERPPRLLDSGPLVFIGFIVFRGGIHLLKVAVAARVCLQAQQRLAPERISDAAKRR